MQTVRRWPSWCLSSRQHAEKTGQLEQILDPKRGSARRHPHKRIRRRYACPSGRNGYQPPVVVVEVDAVLAPVVTTGYERKPAPVQWMEGMRDPEMSCRFIAIGCI